MIDVAKLDDKALQDFDQMMVEASIKVERFASLGTYIWQEVLKELDKRGKVRCDVGSYNDVGNSLITRLYDSEA